MRVDQWMIKTFFLLNLGLLVASCNPTVISGKAQKGGQLASGDFENRAFIYRDSPAMYTAPGYGPANPDMNKFIDKVAPEIVTTNTTLTGNCIMELTYLSTTTRSNMPDCIRSLTNTDNLTPLPRGQDRTWIFAPGTPEFYQVNTLFHVQKVADTFFNKLKFAYERVQSSLAAPKTIPYYLKDTGHFWFKGVSNTDSREFKNSYLNSFALCNKNENSSFEPTGPSLCFGHDDRFPGFYWAQDPTIIYHEFGHAMVSVMMNLRNGTTSTLSHKFRSNLGSFGYGEASAINEGIADWVSYMINKRTHIGEWAMQRTGLSSRPTTEGDPQHLTTITQTSEGRLSYPLYVNYDSNFPDEPFEDVHSAGQITSHYLTALTESFKAKCGIASDADAGHDKATSYVMLLLAETLAEIGDLNAKGIDGFAPGYYFTNMDPENSYLWSHVMNTANHRRFYQIMAKNIYKYISPVAGGLCPSFTKADSEKLLDDYGLLLFKNYNDNGNSTVSRSVAYTSALTEVSEANRRKSVLVSKQLLSLATKTNDTPNAITYYVIDNRSDIQTLLSELLFKGLTVPSSTDVASVDYNNNNLRLSPGEIVAIIPNLHNASNSTMGGVQLLATDWDHVDIYDVTNGYFRPCVIDTVTTVDQGGQSVTPDTYLQNSVSQVNTCKNTTGTSVYPDTKYRRLTKITDATDPEYVAGQTRFPRNAAAPVCLVQIEEGTSTRWVSQGEFRNKQGLTLRDKDCLGYSTSGAIDNDFTFNPHECLTRFVPGANDAFFSKIDPQKNFYDSVVGVTKEKTFNVGNMLLIEINKWVPPGTKFRCRLRARFSNCSDCYNDPTPLVNEENEAVMTGKDDFQDSEFNGHRPFKVINFEFEVND
jgi:hypothetical protein